MIYELGRKIAHWVKSALHFFRAMFCKYYWVDSHGLAECGARGKGCWCEYGRCPRLKGADDET